MAGHPLKNEIPFSRFGAMRVAAGYTQQALAGELGITLRQVQKFEAGDIDMSRVQLGTALKLSAALHVRPEDLIPPADPGDK